MSDHEMTQTATGQKLRPWEREPVLRKLGLFAPSLLVLTVLGLSFLARSISFAGDGVGCSGPAALISGTPDLTVIAPKPTTETCTVVQKAENSNENTDQTAVESPSSSQTRKKPRSKRPSPEESSTPPTGRPAGAQRQETASAAKHIPFVRLVERKGEPQFLQTAVVTYRPTSKSRENSTGQAVEDQQKFPPDLQIDLVGVIHIAERSYYERLNRQLRNYDVVLYELVAPEGTRAEPGARPSHPISAIQLSAKDFLGLSFQLDVIDYHRDNFVHADMSPEELSQAMKERGESVWAMFFRAFGYGLARSQSSQSRTSDTDFVTALFSKDRQLQMKRFFARQLADDVEGQIRVLEGPEGSTLISGRNDKVLQVLQKQIVAGHRKIAIFYGAGHMFHFHQRLLEFGLTPEKIRWLNAWDLRAPSAAQTEKDKTP